MKNKSTKRKTKLSRFIKTKNLIWIIASIFIGVQVLLTIQTASSGSSLAVLEKREKSLIEINQELSRFLVRSSSLSEIEKTADELGFNKPVFTYYVSSEEFVAKLP